MTELQTLGWALIHSLWQGALAAAGLAALFAIIPTRAARARYTLAVAALVLMVALPLVTAMQLGGAATRTGSTEPEAVAPAPAQERAPGPVGPDGTVAPVGTSPLMAAPTLADWIRTAVEPTPALAARAREALEPALPWVVAVWLAGVLVLSLRLASGWRGARWLKRVGVSPAPRACAEALRRLAAQLSVSRPVRVLRSAVVEVPAVIGWLRPVILLPASALTGLTPLQLDALLAHELAHVRRHDYLVNVVQTVIETLLFYHPAVWWVSRRVREEREHCCDDVAVAVCGDAHFYATVLHGMERLRVAAPTLALAAGGASLTGRIRRLVAPARSDILPRWIAGLAAVGLVLAIGGGVRLAGANAAERDDGRAWGWATPTPDTVLRHRNPASSFADRWGWAQAEARRIDGRGVWIGYSVRPSTILEHAGYVDRDTIRRGPSLEDRDSSFGDDPAFGLRGVRLTELVGGHAPDDLALLLRFAPGERGRPVLDQVHVTSFSLPVDFAGGALLWLGSASDGASLARLRALFTDAASGDVKEYLVAAVGLHGDTDAVVSILERWLTSDEAASVRAQVAEWLGHHPSPQAVRALARAARGDRSPRVRREAVDALGDSPLPAAVDSLIALARSHADAGARREAVEELGERRDPRALATLVSIAEGDPDEGVQIEAAEALGDLPDGVGRPALVEVALTHVHPRVRHGAVKTIGEAFRDAASVRVLATIARQDRNVDVQGEAVEALGALDADVGLLEVIDIARTHPNPDVRREAVEAIGEAAHPSAFDTLQEIAQRDRDGDVQREAVDALVNLGDSRTSALLVELARHHPNGEVRQRALERYTQTAPPENALALLTDRLANDRSSAVRRAALNGLAALPGGVGIPAVAAAARTDPSPDVRSQASRRLEEDGEAKVRDVIEREPREP